MSDNGDAIADACSEFYDDPLGWVLWAFDWGHGELAKFKGPDEWQREFLDDLGDQIKLRRFNGGDPTTPIRKAVTSGHGIGKSALTAWLIMFIMSTRPHSKGVVTANTGDQLRTKTWAELAKWKRLCITSDWFDMNSMSIHHKEYHETWRADAQTCREENSEAFAGLHAADATPWYIFDEAGGIPDKIWEVASGGLTDGESMHLAFGNPTKRNTGFFRCFHQNSHRWTCQQVDSRTAVMTNKSYLQELIDDYGIDSDRIRVRIRGLFPRGGDVSYIPADVVAIARKASPGRYLGNDPLICGIDLARGGSDDCYIVFRRGKDARSEQVYTIAGENSRDSMKVVEKIAVVLDRHRPDKTFCDVGAMGGPIADRLRRLNYDVDDVGFGWNAEDKKQFADRASEMWGRARAWLFAGGAISDEDQLDEELTNREYKLDDIDRVKIEPKREMKKRIGKSPDWADAFVLTFASIVQLRGTDRGSLDNPIGSRNVTDTSDYDPLRDM